jgi:hypothetical protein
MADPQALTRRLAVLARDIQSQDDVLHATESICRAAVEMIGQHGFAAVTLVHRAGTVETAAATSDVARRGDALQYELREGPCLDAAWHEKQVYSGDLRSESAGRPGGRAPPTSSGWAACCAPGCSRTSPPSAR